jgi:REP element-mobilizing transposase RayT
MNMVDIYHLPRLPRPYYQAFAAVHWTITLELRATGWLDDSFHGRFRELLLHTAAREALFCPAYVLMPDHIHLLWMGVKLDSDQIDGMRFLRKHLQVEFTKRDSPGRLPLQLQKQSHDNVLREEERKRGAFASVCFYILDNPVRAGLVANASEWTWNGAALPGYPDVHPLETDFWPLFWKLYMDHRQHANLPALPPF